MPFYCLIAWHRVILSEKTGRESGELILHGKTHHSWQASKYEVYQYVTNRNAAFFPKTFYEIQDKGT